MLKKLGRNPDELLTEIITNYIEKRMRKTHRLMVSVIRGLCVFSVIEEESNYC